MFDVWLAFVLLAFAKPIWRWFLRQRAATWPSTQGRIDSTQINDTKSPFRNTRSSNVVTASFTYSYQVNDAKYDDTYKKGFGTTEEAEDFLRDLEGKALTIQYNPARPSRSAIVDSSIHTLLLSRGAPAVPALERHQFLNPVPVWFTRLIPLFETIAIIGFVLSVWVNLRVLTSPWTPPSYFWALHVGIFVAFFPAVFVAQKRVGNTNRKDFWKVMLKNVPSWMKYSLYALFAYAAVLGFPDWFRAMQQASRPGTSSPGGNEWVMFSCVWIVFYWSSFAILYAAMQQERLRPRCINGHPALSGASFCNQCGQPVVRR